MEKEIYGIEKDNNYHHTVTGLKVDEVDEK